MGHYGGRTRQEMQPGGLKYDNPVNCEPLISHEGRKLSLGSPPGPAGEG
jgi:hypothetical protein